MTALPVREDCRHYLTRSTPSGLERRCRVNASSGEGDMFTCPEDCLFFETKTLRAAGWTAAPTERMSNTADLIPEPLPKKRKPQNKKGKGKGKKRR